MNFCSIVSKVTRREGGSFGENLMGRSGWDREYSQGPTSFYHRSACAHLSDGFSLSYFILPPPLSLFLSSSHLCLSLFIIFFLIWSLYLPLSSVFFASLSLFLSRLPPLYLSPYVSIFLCLSVPSPPHHSPRLPSLFLSLSTVKKRSLMVPKVSALYSCPVLCCLSVSER